MAGHVPSVDRTFNSILLGPKLLGVFPFDQSSAKISPRWCFYSLVIFLTSLTLLCFVVIHPPAIIQSSWIRKILFQCQMISLFTSMCIMYWSVVLKRLRLSELFRSLSDLKVTPPEKEPKFRMILGYCTLQAIVIIHTGSWDAYANEPLGNIMKTSLTYYYFMITVISSGLLPFVSVLEVLSCKFEAMITKMVGLLKAPNPKNYLGDVLRFVFIYNKSANIISSLNIVYNFQLLLISFVSFINVVTNMYFIVDYVVSTKIHQLQDAEDKSKIIPVNLGWILIFSSLIFFPVHSCQRMVQQAKEFNTLLYQLMINDRTNEIASNKKLRLHISMKREVVFTAFDFFTLDYRLIHSMIAAATTYLVILIQFGQPDKTSNDSSTDSAMTNVTSMAVTTPT